MRRGRGEIKGLWLEQTKPASSPVALRHRKATGGYSRGHSGEKTAEGGPERPPGVIDMTKATLKTLLEVLALE